MAEIIILIDFSGFAFSHLKLKLTALSMTLLGFQASQNSIDQ